MRCSLKILLLACLCVVLVGSASAEGDPIQFGRTPDISPDGKLVAFSYAGDIWTVPAIGGIARPITGHTAHDYRPIFSPDGKQIAFSSKREDQYDVYVVSVFGGRPTRLTYHSSNDYVCDWSPDGKSILFVSSRGLEYPFRDELFSVPVTGGRVSRHTFSGGREGAYSPDGKQLVFTRGPGTLFRQKYRGSSNTEIWLQNIDGSHNRQFTKFNGQDSSPNWGPDGKAIYYVTNSLGKHANIVRQIVLGKASLKPEPITFHKNYDVRQARLSRDGNWLVYTCGPDLWIVSTRGTPARKMLIEAYADDKTNPNTRKKYTSGASEMFVSPNERYTALVLHGELFVIPRRGGKALRMTDNPANDRDIAWSGDSRTVFFVSDRGGHEDIWAVEPEDPRTRVLNPRTKLKVRRLTNTPEAESHVLVSPNGSRVSFIRNGKLSTMKPDGTDVRVVVDQSLVINYAWSPDSKWICYSRIDGSYASEMYIVPANGATSKDPPRNITRFATFNAYMHWSEDSPFIAFLTQRGLTNKRTAYILGLQKRSVPGASKRSRREIDWDNIHHRVQEISSKESQAVAISSNARWVAFRDAPKDALWLVDVRDGSTKRLAPDGTKPTLLTWSKLLPNLLYYLDGKGTLQLMNVADPKPEAVQVPFEAEMTINRHEEFLEVFDQSWLAIREHFYDPSFHGVDWEKMRTRYRPLVNHIRMREDLNALISMMLSELNSSHLGIQAPSSEVREKTAYLGLLFDEKHLGQGLRIQAVLPRGPADLKGLDLKVGDVVESIDGTRLTDSVNVAKVLASKSKNVIQLGIRGRRSPVDIKGADRRTMAVLMYERWIKGKAERVDQLSGGKLGYIHVPGMDEAGLKRFIRALYSDNFDKEGIVIDVRFNGGGNTHDRLLNYLGGKIHTLFYQRHGGVGNVFRAGDRKWVKPLVLLINNESFSDAEIFPSAFKTLKLGKVIGVATGGQVIGTGTTKLIDGSTFRIPRTGIFTIRGVNMEKEGVVPDLVVHNDPNELTRNIDRQLERAVEILSSEVQAWKKSPEGIAYRKLMNGNLPISKGGGEAKSPK
ncbi:MAG: S41 family peptidase [Gemmataceae bacterium]